MRILVSDSAKGVYHGMVNEIVKSLNNQHEVTVLVPDRFTMSVERGLLESLGKDSSFLLEVQSFNYLARNELNKKLSRYLTPQGSVMLMADVIDKNKSDLVYYKKAAGKDGFAEEFSDAINIIRRSGIDPKTLSQSEIKLDSNVTGQKAHDLALVYEKYIEALGNAFSDASTRLEVFAGWLRQQDKQENHDYFIMDYYDLSATEINIINALDTISDNVCLGLTSGLNNPNKDIYPAEKIIERIKETNSNVTITEKKYPMEPQQEILSKYLFSYRVPSIRVENKDKYNIFKANSIYEELLRVAIDIKSKVIDKKARYLDFEVVCAQPQIYYPQLKAIFKRLDIPFFIDQKEPLMAQTQIRFLLSMLEVVRTGYRREDVLSFVKNPLFVTLLRFKENNYKLNSNVDDENYEDEMKEKLQKEDETLYKDYVNKFENYVLKYSINYTIFKSPFDITHEQDNKVSDEDYEKVEFVRREMYEFISVFEQEDLSTAANLSDAVKNKSLAIKDLWNYHKMVIEQLDDNKYYAKVAEQVNKKIDQILDEIKEILGNTPKNVEGFIDMFKTMIENMNISLVPTFRDCVYVGDGQSRFMGLGKIYIVGAAQGAFPSVYKSGIIISDTDEENFGSIGLRITPTLKERNYTERLAALEILKKSRQETDISYSTSTPNGASQPSFVLLQMESMLIDENGEPIKTKEINLDDLASLEPQEREKIEKVLFSTEESKYYSTLRNLFSGRVDESNNKIYGTAYNTLKESNKNAIQSIFRYPTNVDGDKLLGTEKDASTSISKIETFFTCPYKYFLQYGLDLKQRDSSRIQTYETGIIIHAVLQYFFEEIMYKRVNELNLESKIEAAFDKTLEKHPRHQKMAQGERKRLFAKLLDECKEICSQLYHNSSKSLFSPIMLEQKFGAENKDKKTLPGIKLNVRDKDIIFKGQIDRVDQYDDKVYIIDYKTYKNADINLSELYFGKQIQLFLYMRALQKLNYNPVGVFYQPIYATYDKDVEVNRFKFKGVVHNTPGIQESIDPDYLKDKEKSFAAYEMIGRAPNKVEDPETIMDPAKMDMLGEYSEDVARSGVEDIMDGLIEPLPYAGSCANCAYKKICGYIQDNERNKQTVHLKTYENIYAPAEEEFVEPEVYKYARNEDIR